MKITLMLISLMLLASCSDFCTCKDEMKKVKKKYGEPEEVNTYTSKNYKSEDWWYWSKGVKFGFVWGGSECECAKSKYTFDPIEKRVVTEEDRQRIESSKRIVSEEIIRQDDCIVCSQ